MAEAVTPASEDEAQYRIEATGGFREPRTRILKHGDTFAVFNAFGAMVGGAEVIRLRLSPTDTASPFNDFEDVQSSICSVRGAEIAC